jgi:quercetin dioxygenase-like cupin family protein
MSTALAAAVSAPTRIRIPDLLGVADRYADDVISGRFDRLFPSDGLPGDERWYTRLHSDDDLDVWLISWVPGHSTELHDHAGSLGALTVLSGALREYRWDRGLLRSRRLDAGDQAAFPLGWVHDISADDPGETLSVHAYSPPLTAMSYYEVTEQQRLRRVRSELTA